MTDKQQSEGVEPLHRIPAVAAQLGVHEFTVRRWIWDKKIRAIRIGPRLLRIPASEVRRLTAATTAAEPRR